MTGAVVGGLLGTGLLLLVLRRPTAERVTRSGRGLLRRLGLPDATRLVPLSFVSGVVAAMLAVVSGQGPVGIAVLAAAGAAVPTLAFLLRSGARRAALESHWPDLVDHLVAQLRSGAALPDAVGALSRHAHPLLASALRECEREWRQTGRFDLALDRLKDACADPAADRVVEILRMANEVGGREALSVLRTLSQHLRDDHALASELRSRRSWVTNTARLGVCAPWVVLALLATRPETLSAYASPTGAIVLVSGAAVCVVAYRAVVRIGRPSPTRRWLA